MPTTVRESFRRSSPPPWREVARLYVLLARVRWIDARLNFLYRGGQSPQGEKLLRLMEEWLALHERISDLLPGIPEPPHVQEIRGIFELIAAKRSEV